MDFAELIDCTAEENSDGGDPLAMLVHPQTSLDSNASADSDDEHEGSATHAALRHNYMRSMTATAHADQGGMSTNAAVSTRPCAAPGPAALSPPSKRFCLASNLYARRAGLAAPAFPNVAGLTIQMPDTPRARAAARELARQQLAKQMAA